MDITEKKQIIDTWAPVLETLSGSEMRGEKLEYMAIYAHAHTLLENAEASFMAGNGMGTFSNTTPPPMTGGDTTNSLLPVALKILNGVDFGDCKVRITQGPIFKHLGENGERKTMQIETRQIACDITVDDIKQLGIFGIDATAEVENVLVNEAISEFQKVANNSSYIYIYNLAQSLSTIAEGTYQPRMALRSRYTAIPKENPLKFIVRSEEVEFSGGSEEVLSEVIPFEERELDINEEVMTIDELLEGLADLKKGLRVLNRSITAIEKAI